MNTPEQPFRDYPTSQLLDLLRIREGTLDANMKGKGIIRSAEGEPFREFLCPGLDDSFYVAALDDPADGHSGDPERCRHFIHGNVLLSEQGRSLAAQ